ncbi:MAG: hypothetical protein IPO67_06300 [Deltaproteobacteria bacterium]|nr:hypothetical protein [Deltaproteobacteria bacterium]
MQEVLYSPGHQATWHHYLHGDQSEEAVGWLCRPERRPILVNSEHLRHLQELLEVYAGVTIADRPALSVANLSQSDPNLQAGQGALCVAVHLRVPAEEGSPPRVGHGLLTVKRQLQPAALGETLRTLTKLSGVLAPSGERGLEDAYLGFLVAETPQEARAAWLNYLSAFDAELPVAPISDPEHEWIPQSDARMPERIAVLGRGPDDHGRILEVMAGLASVLYQSSVRWGELTTSRRVPADREGLVIQLLADSEPAALVERAVPLAELEGEVEDWITKVLPLRRTRIESASPFTDQSWSTSRRREVVNVPEINRPKPQRERLELPRERVELPATPTPEPRQRPRSAVDVVELPLRAPDPPRPVAPPPPPPQVQRAVSLDPPVPIAPLPVSLPPPPTLPPTNPDELHEPMSVRTPWDSSLSLPFNPPPPMVSEGPMVRSPNPRPMPPPVADFFGGAAAPPVDDEQIFAGDEDVSEEASSPSEPGIPSEPGLFAEPFEAPAPPPPAPPPPPPAPPPPPPRPAATLQDFIDEGQRPNVAPVEVPRSSGKGRRRPTVDESAPTPLSRQRSDTILAIGLDEDAPVPRSRPTPPPQRALDQNEESWRAPRCWRPRSTAAATLP